jgi:hypothetical protein
MIGFGRKNRVRLLGSPPQRSSEQSSQEKIFQVLTPVKDRKNVYLLAGNLVDDAIRLPVNLAVFHDLNPFELCGDMTALGHGFELKTSGFKIVQNVIRRSDIIIRGERQTRGRDDGSSGRLVVLGRSRRRKVSAGCSQSQKASE